MLGGIGPVLSLMAFLRYLWRPAGNHSAARAMGRPSARSTRGLTCGSRPSTAWSVRDTDSPLEGDGFEPSVPLVNASAPCCRRECRSDRTGKSRDRSIPHERARNPFTSPVCPSASEIAARSPRMRAARDGVATAPGLSRQRASGQCDVGTVRAAGQPRHFRQPAVSEIAIHALISEVFSPVALTKIDV